MIEGLLIKPLKQIADSRGKVMHMLRADDSHFGGFGEIYFSVVNPGVVKAWKKHLRMTQNFAVPSGKIRLVIYDDRKDSKTRGQIEIIETGEDSYALIQIPPLLWYGFKGISAVPAMIANCSDIPHDPSETERREDTDKSIPYEWK